VHDSQIEDRLRSVLRKEGDELTLNITAQELERRLALRRRERAGRRVSLLAAGVAVLAIGGLVVAQNGWFGAGPAVGGNPGPTAVAASAPPDSAAPGASGSPTPGPSALEDSDLGCSAVDPSATAVPPAVIAGVVPGDSIGFGGTVVAARWNAVESGTPGSWDGLTSTTEAISTGSDQVLEVTSDGCFEDVSAEALLTIYAQPPALSPTPVALDVIRGIGGRVVDIEPPATGGWTVRIRATFVTTDGSEAWSETLYRVFGNFDAPRLTMSQGGGGHFVFAQASCPSYQLASGASAADQCGGPYEPLRGVAPLVVAKGASVTLELSDTWRIDQAKVTAVQADRIAAGTNAPEYSVAFVDKGGRQISVPIVLDPGSWIVRVSLNGSRGGDIFGAYYDLPVTIAP
jgi:hypothetical protein